MVICQSAFILHFRQMQGKSLILELIVNIANNIVLPTGKLVLALHKKLTYGKVDQEQISTISIQVVILMHRFNLGMKYVKI